MNSETLGFDKAQRLQLCRAFLERVAPAGPEEPALPAILDLGGYPAILADWLAPERRVVTVDRPECAAPGYVRGSGDRLPFGDGVFRATVANDVLEHIPADRREDFLKEMARTSAEWIFLAGPFDFPWVREGEAILNETIRLVTGRTNPWLDEHTGHGLPDLADARAALGRLGFASAVAETASFFNWVVIKHADYLAEAIPDAFALSRLANEAFAQDWAEGDHRAPTYRHVIVAHRDAAVLRDLTQTGEPLMPGIVFRPPGEAPPAPPQPEIDRGLALCRVFADLTQQAAKALGAAQGQSGGFDAAYTRRLETIIEGHEEARRRDEEEVAQLRARLAAYEGSRFIALWRRLRGR